MTPLPGDPEVVLAPSKCARPVPSGAIEPADADLVARAKTGDRAAEEAIYRRHVRYIAGMVARLLGNRAEAEDCVQETFAIALERLGALRDDGAVRAWLAQIAVSQVRRRFRRQKLLRFLGLERGVEPGTLDAFASPEASPEVHAELGKLARLLSSLPTEQRLAWSLRYVEGSALEEVAAACECSLATAKRRIAAADARVRASVDVEVAR